MDEPLSKAAGTIQAFRSVTLAIALLLPLAGCGGRSDLPPRAKVSGVVTLDGQPLTIGLVQFSPDQSKDNKGPVAVGQIDSTGHYQLTTDRQGGDGAVLGFHKIRVEAREQPKNEMDTLPASLVPRKYLHPDTSGLTAEVKPVELNEIGSSGISVA